jgi:hypothetical protein
MNPLPRYGDEQGRHVGCRDETMAHPFLRTPYGQIELRPIAPAAGAEHIRTYLLLPELDELVGVPGFGLRNPIVVGRKSKDLFGLMNLRFH